MLEDYVAFSEESLFEYFNTIYQAIGSSANIAVWILLIVGGLVVALSVIRRFTG